MKSLLAETVRAKKWPGCPGRRRGPHTRFLCQLLSPWFSRIYSASLFSASFENLGTSGRWVQGNHLGGQHAPEPRLYCLLKLPQLFPVKCSFISESTLNGLKENVEGKEKWGGGKSECHLCCLFRLCLWLFSPAGLLAPWRALYSVATKSL